MTTLPRSKLSGTLTGHIAGDGADMVLLHGVGLRAEAWLPMLPILAEHARLHVVDLPGHGESPLGTHKTLADFVDTIGEYSADLTDPYIIGHSMGAMIALEVTINMQAQIIGVAALNAIYRRDEKAKRAVQTRANDLANSALPDPQPTLERWFGDKINSEYQDASRNCRDWLTACDQKGYAAAYHVFAHHDGPADAHLADLARPALFITGSEEPNSTPIMSEEMARLAPIGHCHIVDGAAHMGPMTHPDAYANVILDHFRRAR